MTVVAGWRPEGQQYDEFEHGPKTGRFKTCKVCGGMHATHAWPDNCRPETPWLKSDLPSPMIISDTIEVQSMTNMKVFTSKSKYYRHVRESGCEIVGSERPKAKCQKSEREIDREIGQAVKDSLDQLRSGTLTDEAMGNMMRHKPESQGGFHVE